MNAMFVLLIGAEPSLDVFFHSQSKVVAKILVYLTYSRDRVLQEVAVLDIVELASICGLSYFHSMLHSIRQYIEALLA